MSKIKDIFKKDIDRNIRGVIKIGQDSEKIKKQELEEYVVTDELKQDFTKFFDSYDRSINNITDEMGVWISGFFGSGKSHFLKILSYLLENDQVAGRNAVDYFLKDGKFDDDHLANAINKATGVPTDVALFNIDSKADSNAANDSSAILTVFLKVFNEQLGYSSIPVVADMERWLDSENKYEDFKNAFQDLDPVNHTTWEAARSKYAILTTRIQQALIKAGILSENDAKNYNLQTRKFSISPEGFAKLVKEYLDNEGQDHHFVFLADEVGQFIGDDDKRMLNLQTIVEQLGVQCQGRAWVIVTSQQQMDEVTESFSRHERDFSKIQGRFNTLINMSSANADEVIRKRLLDKKPLAIEQLQDLYAANKYAINNKINFSDSIKRQKYDDAEEFVENYPFVPYQFSLLKDVLAAVRKRGANGSHMSDGERSMLATFQEATRRYENDNIGKLVPFAAFFIGMKEFLSHDHQVVFDKAIGDKYINPNHEDYCFNIQVLAVLFMVKYVDNYPSTLDNIVTLLLDDIDQDRVELTAKVKDALNVLLRQNYIQQKLDTYEFLTDSEQEVNESINAIEVDDRKVVQRIGTYLLSDNLIDPKYNYPKMKNQYIFEFNMYIDGSGLNRLSNDINIRVVSPLQEKDYTDLDFKQTTSDGKNIVIVLKDDDRYIENYRRVEKINEYLQSPESRSDLKKQEIALRRRDETKEIEMTTQKMLEDDLLDADIYVLGEVLPKGSNFEARLNKAKQEIIDTNYRDLKYLTSVKSDTDIVNLFKGNKEFSLVGENEQAINEVVTHIISQTSSMNNVSFASVSHRFSQIPYGYKATDVAWLVAKAFVDGRLKLYFNNEQVTISDAKEDSKGTEKYFLSKNNASKLTIKPVKEISAKQKRDAKEFVEEVLDKRLIMNPDDTSEQIAEDIKNKTEQVANHLNELAKKEFSYSISYPNRDLLLKGVHSLDKIANVKENDTIFQYISDNLDDLEGWHDELDDLAVLDFYGDVESESEQQKIWNRSQEYKNRYDSARGLIKDDDLKNVAEQIDSNLRSNNFNKSIPALRKLNSEFIDKYNNAVQALSDEINQEINTVVNTLKSRVDDAQFPNNVSVSLNDQIDSRFNSLVEVANKYSESNEFNSYINLYGLKHDIEDNRQYLQDKIDDTSTELAKKAKEENEEKIPSKVKTTVKIVDNDTSTASLGIKVTSSAKVTRSMNISELVKENSWHITSEEELNRYIGSLRSELEKELKDTDILNIDFK